MTQLVIGFLSGLILGVSVRLFRPALLVLLAALCVGAAVILYQSGLPGLTLLLERMAQGVRAFPAFFTALGIGKLIGDILSRGA